MEKKVVYWSDPKEPSEVMLPVYRTPSNAHLFAIDAEVNELPSETIPDMSMTIREILDRYSRGLPISGTRVPTYNEEGDEEIYPDLKSMDLTERQEYLEKVAHDLETLQNAKLKKQQMLKDAVEKELEELREYKKRKEIADVPPAA